jgi:hypothetical protein
VSLVELWQRGQAGWPRHFPVVQFPNAPLLVALAARAATWTGERDGAAARVGRSLFMLGFGVWAAEELADGTNWFRRLLGLAGLAWLARMARGAWAPPPGVLDDAAVPRPDIPSELDGRRGMLA